MIRNEMNSDFEVSEIIDSRKFDCKESSLATRVKRTDTHNDLKLVLYCVKHSDLEYDRKFNDKPSNVCQSLSFI